MAGAQVESFEDVAQKFPGVDQLDPNAIGKFVFHAAGNFPEALYEAEVIATDNEAWRQPPRESWKDEIGGLLTEIKTWRQNRQERLGVTITRYELAKAVESSFALIHETAELLKTFISPPPQRCV